MEFPKFDQVRPVPGGTTPPYDVNNPLLRLIGEAQLQQRLASERENYHPYSIQYLFPYKELSLYGPAQGAPDAFTPASQNIKTDFQKQNIADFSLGDFFVIRGYAAAGDWAGVFLKIVYRGTPGTALGKQTAGDPGLAIKLHLKVNGVQSPSLITMPLNPKTGNYEIELWSYAGATPLGNLLDLNGKKAIDLGLLQARPDLVKGSLSDFEGEGIDKLRGELNRRREGWQILDHAPEHCMHPVRPLKLEIAFAKSDESVWDSQGGRNYKLVFNMAMRGWKSFLSCGISGNPHGGVGFLEYRNLFSNYFYEKRRMEIHGDGTLPELGRDLIPGNFDANTYGTNAQTSGPNLTSGKRESFMAVDYMDLHILQPECSIGIHRHRDNQEAFLMLAGHGLMMVGDWAEFPDRDRAFEIRHMLAGDIALCKTGQLHALFNVMDEPCSLFMFGGYD